LLSCLENQTGTRPRANLATADGIEEVVQKIGGTGKTLDVLINNAAVADVVSFDSVTREQYDYALSLNLAAPFSTLL